MLVWILIFVAGGLGSVLRHAAARGLAAAERAGLVPPHPAFPWHTLIVNVLGCVAIGWVTPRIARGEIPPTVAAAITVGLLGGFTTFSSFGRETVELMRSGRGAEAAAYVAISVGAGVAAVWLASTTPAE